MRSGLHRVLSLPRLEAVALGPNGRPRMRRLSFAGRFDMQLFGRRGIERPPDEAALDPYRQRFAAMFGRLQREHGVPHVLAHNMTVTLRNLDQIAGVVRRCHGFGFGMFSFQPAAFVGDDRRWDEDYRDTTTDEVWAQIERGAGSRLPFRVFQMGDDRCNRTAYGFYVGDRWYPYLDDRSPADLRVRDAHYRYLGGINFSGTPLPMLPLAPVTNPRIKHPATEPIAIPDV